MKKAVKTLLAIGILAAGAAGIAKLLQKRAGVQLDVSALERSVGKEYPGAEIISIEKTDPDADLYLVMMKLVDKEYKLFADSAGTLLSVTPPVETAYASEDEAQGA